MKKGKKPKPSITDEVLLIDEAFTIHRKKGNGAIRRQVWGNKKGTVTRYSLAYINPHLFQDDNGRVLGYDNAHNYHHRHYFGKIEPITFMSFESIEEQFQQEFEVLHAQTKKRQ